VTKCFCTSSEDIISYTQTSNIFVVANVVTISDINGMLFVTLRDVVQ